MVKVKVVVYLIAVCPYDGYMWRVRGTDDNTGDFISGYHPPLMCPQDKRRFVGAVEVASYEDAGRAKAKVLKRYKFNPAAGATGTLVLFKMKFENYRGWLMFLEEQKKKG